MYHKKNNSLNLQGKFKKMKKWTYAQYQRRQEHKIVGLVKSC